MGALLLLGLFAIIIWRAFRIARMSRDLYGTLIAAGIAGVLVFQVFVNIGMTIGIMPVTGLPLPFVSFGSSSLVVFLMAIGLLESVHVHSVAGSAQVGTLTSRAIGRLRVAKLPVNLSKALEAWKEASSRTGAVGRHRPGWRRPPGGARAAAVLERGARCRPRGSGPLAELPGLCLGSRGGAGGAGVRPRRRPRPGRARAVGAQGRSGRGGRRRRRGDGQGDLSGPGRDAAVVLRHARRLAPAVRGVRRGGRRAARWLSGAGIRRSGPRRPSRVIYRTAGQNALIGLAFFVPGADMPAMTLNQIKMVLSLAGIYGEKIDRERAVELVGGRGRGLRAPGACPLARSAAAGHRLGHQGLTGLRGTVARGSGGDALLRERRARLHQPGGGSCPVRCGVERDGRSSRRFEDILSGSGSRPG